MQAFRFRLDKVLEWHSRQFEEEKRRLSALLAALSEIQRAIAALHSERLNVERELISQTAIAAPDFVALSLYRLAAEKREAELTARRTRAEADVAGQRGKLQAAQRRVRLLEKLRDRRLAEHTYAQTRELEELAADAFFATWAER